MIFIRFETYEREREREREREVLRFDGGQEFQPPTPLYYELGGLSY